MSAASILPGSGAGAVLASDEAISFWGGVDPVTGRVIDAHHPLHGEELAGRVLMLPTSRGSCTGSGVILDLILADRAPAAILFHEPEDVVTLGALVGAEMFGARVPVLRLSRADWHRAAQAAHLNVGEGAVTGEGLHIEITPLVVPGLALTALDRAILEGAEGRAAAQAMRILIRMAGLQGASALTDVSRVHIDGCIYASRAHLTFAETMRDLGARVRVPATMNAISVDRENWRVQGVPDLFGGPAQRLADAYVAMGCAPSFTCAPYLLGDDPAPGEAIGWSESNAVIYANSVLGARSPKHPDFLDLCIALTGRAPLAGVYLDAARVPKMVIEVTRPEGADDLFWPLLGWLAGRLSPEGIPVLTGLADAGAGSDDLKALCAAFGTTSAAPMLHVEGVTPEAPPGSDHAGLPRQRIGVPELAAALRELQAIDGPPELIAIGSPHASVGECTRLLDELDALQAGAGAPVRLRIPCIITAGRQVIAQLRAEGIAPRLEAMGVQLVPDLCWCSISEPVLPPAARRILTNSGKYAHYGPGLSGRQLAIASLADCARAALTGEMATAPPAWLQGRDLEARDLGVLVGRIG